MTTTGKGLPSWYFGFTTMLHERLGFTVSSFALDWLVDYNAAICEVGADYCRFGFMLDIVIFSEATLILA